MTAKKTRGTSTKKKGRMGMPIPRAGFRGDGKYNCGGRIKRK